MNSLVIEKNINSTNTDIDSVYKIDEIFRQINTIKKQKSDPLLEKFISNYNTIYGKTYSKIDMYDASIQRLMNYIYKLMRHEKINIGLLNILKINENNVFNESNNFILSNIIYYYFANYFNSNILDIEEILKYEKEILKLLEINSSKSYKCCVLQNIFTELKTLLGSEQIKLLNEIIYKNKINFSTSSNNDLECGICYESHKFIIKPLCCNEKQNICTTCYTNCFDVCPFCRC